MLLVYISINNHVKTIHTNNYSYKYIRIYVATFIFHVCHYYVCMHYFTELWFVQTRKKMLHNLNFSVPEVKILILLSTFIIFGVVLSAFYSSTVYQANPLMDDLNKYFACQLGGFDPMCEDIRRQFEKHLQPELSALTYLLMGIITVVYLLFAIQAQDIKKLIQRIRSCFMLVYKYAYKNWMLQTSDISAKSSLLHTFAY